MGNFYLNYKNINLMGGVSTAAVNCADFAEAEAVESTITSYIKDGLQPEAEIFIYYSWYWWAMYIWILNVQSYLMAIEAISLCDVSNGTGSAFGEDWLGTTFYPTMQGYVD